MTSTVGYFAVGGSLLLSVIGAVAAFVAVKTKNPGTATLARRAAYGVFALATLAITSSVAGLTTSNVSPDAAPRHSLLMNRSVRMGDHLKR